MSVDSYELVIGLETHARVNSKTKMFCSCENSIELNTEANTNVCPICMGFPGALPTVSMGVIDLAVRAGIALGCEIQQISQFDRKSYFYPDLPPAYQITQFYHPIARNGVVKTFVNNELKEFHIDFMHIEADAGKLTHSANKTLIDYNRAMSPLMEIVTKPDFRSADEVTSYLKELQKLLRFVGASNADMEKGQMRCDVNISIRPKGSKELNNRVELKNINSFSAISRAIKNEFKRQITLTENGETVTQETRGWDDENGKSYSMRSKEDAMDYRYFPEPDLPPLELSKEYISERQINERPIDRQIKYLEEYKLLEDDARILSHTKDISDYYEKLVELTKDPKKSCSYVTSVLLAMMQEMAIESFDTLPFDITELAYIITLVNHNELSSTWAKTIIEELMKNWGKAEDIIESKGLKQNNDTEALEGIVKNIIKNFPDQVAEYKSGKENLFGFFVGQCMKSSKGQGNPKIFNELLKKHL